MQETPEIPGLAEAIEKEQTRRNLAFSGTHLPIGGVWVNQFTPLHWVNLGLVRSPFLGGNRGTAFSTVSVLEFLWVVSPSYRPGAFWRELWFYARHYRSIKPATAIGIFDYLDAAFMDSPASPVGNNPHKRSYYAGVTSICDFFAVEYGWDDAVTMQKPLARLFQYFNCVKSRKQERPLLFNPSDRIRGQALHQGASHAR